MRMLAFLVLLGGSVAWAQTAPQAPRVQKKDPKAPTVRKAGPLDTAAEMEKRRAEALSNASKKRHDKAANSARNAR